MGSDTSWFLLALPRQFCSWAQRPWESPPGSLHAPRLEREEGQDCPCHTDAACCCSHPSLVLPQYNNSTGISYETLGPEELRSLLTTVSTRGRGSPWEWPEPQAAVKAKQEVVTQQSRAIGICFGR